MLQPVFYKSLMDGYCLEDNCGKNYVDLIRGLGRLKCFQQPFRLLLLANAINAIKDESFIFNTNGKLIISQKESPQSKFLATISYAEGRKESHVLTESYQSQMQR